MIKRLRQLSRENAVYGCLRLRRKQSEPHLHLCALPPWCKNHPNLMQYVGWPRHSILWPITDEERGFLLRFPKDEFWQVRINILRAQFAHNEPMGDFRDSAGKFVHIEICHESCVSDSAERPQFFLNGPKLEGCSQQPLRGITNQHPWHSGQLWQHEIPRILIQREAALEGFASAAKCHGKRISQLVKILNEPKLETMRQEWSAHAIRFDFVDCFLALLATCLWQYHAAAHSSWDDVLFRERRLSVRAVDTSICRLKYLRLKFRNWQIPIRNGAALAIAVSHDNYWPCRSAVGRWPVTPETRVRIPPFQPSRVKHDAETARRALQ